MVNPMHGSSVMHQAQFSFFTDEDAKVLNARLQRRGQNAAARQLRVVSPRVVWVDPLQEQLELLERPLYEGPPPVDVSPALRDLQENLGDAYGAGAPNIHSDAADADELLQAEEGRVSDQFTDHGVAILHVGLLEHSLAVLAGRGNPMEKAETLRWFFLPDIRYWVENKVKPDEESATPRPPRPMLNSVAKYRPVHASELPFTFQRCCAYAGVSHELVLERLRHILRKAGLGQYMPA